MTATKTATGWDAIAKRLDTLPTTKRTMSLCADADVRDRYQTAKQAYERAAAYLESLPADVDADARTLAAKTAAKAEQELQDAKAAYDPITVVLTFQALDRQHVEKLISEHPPHEDEEARGNEFHFDTFAPELIAAASLDGMPVEYAANALRTWSLADSDDLWAAAWTVQRRKRSDLGKG